MPGMARDASAHQDMIDATSRPWPRTATESSATGFFQKVDANKAVVPPLRKPHLKIATTISSASALVGFIEGTGLDLKGAPTAFPPATKSRYPFRSAMALIGKWERASAIWPSRSPICSRRVSTVSRPVPLTTPS